MTFKISDADDHENVFLQVLSIDAKYVFDVVILVVYYFRSTRICCGLQKIKWLWTESL
jgi:hypothetical protein